MVKYLLTLMLFIGLTAAVNAQSEGCCSKDKAEASTVKAEKATDKICDVPETVNIKTVSNKSESSAVVASAMGEDKVKKADVKDSGNSDSAKDEKGCCSTEKKKTDKPAQ
jgi:hypothetical protein